jgi:protein-disulfide isomerase
MKSILTGGAAALALLLAGCGDGGGNGQAPVPDTPLKQIAAPNGDWTQMVVKTPEGGFRMGNPDAPAKLVEYGSLSCPHCAEFEETGGPQLRDKYVKSGQVSWEFRTYLLFGPDAGISALLHCQGESAFFPMVEQLYADQRNWSGRLQSLPEAQLQQIQGLPAREAAGAMLRATGVDEFFRQRGMPASRIQSCLADPAVLDRLTAITKRAGEEGVNSTPSFVLNGKVLERTANWAALEPELRAAIR